MSLLDEVLNPLNIPEKCKVDKTVFKKLFEQANDGYKNKCLQQNWDSIRDIHRAGNQFVFRLPGKFQ